jgi:hypothetical protein
MKRLLPSLLLALVTLALQALAMPAQLSAQNASPRRDDAVVVLISEKEAALSTGKASAFALASNEADNRAITRNPKIFLVSPGTAAATGSLIHFEIKFVAFNGAQVDPKQVKVTYLKDSPIDLTPRVAAFIRGDGIDIPRAQVAPGKHQIEVDVVDTEGREASKQLTLDVGR